MFLSDSCVTVKANSGDWTEWVSILGAWVVGLVDLVVRDGVDSEETSDMAENDTLVRKELRKGY